MDGAERIFRGEPHGEEHRGGGLSPLVTCRAGGGRYLRSLCEDSAAAKPRKTNIEGIGQPLNLVSVEREPRDLFPEAMPQLLPERMPLPVELAQFSMTSIGPLRLSSVYY